MMDNDGYDIGDVLILLMILFVVFVYSCSATYVIVSIVQKGY